MAARRTAARRAALAFSLIASLSTTAIADEALSLRDAIRKALTGNPELRNFAWDFKAQDGLAAQAAVRPNPQLNVQAEDFAGTGNSRGFTGTEFSLSLSQALELGDKRRRRVEVASEQRRLIEADRAIRQLDVVAEVARCFIAVAADQARVELAMRAVTLATANFLPDFNRRLFEGGLPGWLPLAAIGPFVAYELVALSILRSRITRDSDFPRIARRQMMGTTQAQMLQFEIASVNTDRNRGELMRENPEQWISMLDRNRDGHRHQSGPHQDHGRAGHGWRHRSRRAIRSAKGVSRQVGCRDDTRGSVTTSLHHSWTGVRETTTSCIPALPSPRTNANGGTRARWDSRRGCPRSRRSPSAAVSPPSNSRAILGWARRARV